MIHVKFQPSTREDIQCDRAAGDHVHVFGKMGPGDNNPQVTVTWTLGPDLHSQHHAEKTKRTVGLLKMFKDQVFAEVAGAIEAEFRLKRQ